jgi:hypothetical protein
MHESNAKRPAPAFLSYANKQIKATTGPVRGIVIAN